jgi:hypothetical protein
MAEDDVLRLKVEASADEAKGALNDTVDSIGALVAKVQGSEGDLRILESVLRADAASGIELTKSLQDLARGASTVGAGVAAAAQSLMDHGAAAQAATQQSGELGSVFDGLAASIRAEADAAQAAQAGAAGMGDVFDSLAASLTQTNAVAKATTAQVQEIADAGAGFAKFADGVKDFIENPLKAIGSLAKDAIMALGPIGTVAVSVAAGIAELGREMFSLVNSAGSAALAVQNFGLKINLGYQETKQLGMMAQLVDTNINSLAMAAWHLADALAQPGSKKGKELLDLGITAKDSGQALLQLLQVLAQIPDKTERLKVAHDLLGRSAQNLLPLISNYEMLTSAVDKLSNHLSDEATQSLIDAHVHVNELKLGLDQLYDKIASLVAKPFTIVVNAILNATTLDNSIDAQIARKQAELNRLNFDAKAVSGQPKLDMGKPDDLAPKAGLLGRPDSERTADMAAMRKQKEQELDDLRAQKEATQQTSAFEKAQNAERVAAAKLRQADDAKTLDGMKNLLAAEKEIERNSRALYLAPGPPEEIDKAGVAMRNATAEVTRLEAAIKAAEKKATPGKDMSQWAAVEEKKAQNQRRLGLEMVAAADEQAHQLLKTHDITQAQLTERLLAAEDARYAIEVNAATRMDELKKKVALAEKKPVPAPDKAPEVLKADHENRQQKIKDTGSDAAMKQDDELAKARIQNTEKVALAQVEAETQAARSAFAAQKVTLEQETQAQLDESTKRYAIQLNAANADMVLAKAKGKDGEKEVLDLTTKIETLYIAHEAELTKIAADGENKRKQATEATELARIKGALDSGTKTVELQQQRVDFEAKLGLISNQQKLQSERDLDSQLDALQRTAIEREMALLDVKDVNYAKKEQELQNKLAALRAQAALRQQKEMEDSLTHTAAIYTKILGGIGTAFQTSVDAVIRGTQTIGGAFANMGKSLILTWTNDLVQLGVKWAQFELLRLVVSKATAASITGVKVAQEGIVTSATAAARAKDAAGEGAIAVAAAASAGTVTAAKIAATTAAATAGALERTAEIVGLAAVAAAAAFAATAAIPLTGPAAAPAAAALAYTQVMAYAPQAAAERGWDLPATGGPFPALLHKKEMVLPEEQADTIRSLKKGGQDQGGGGDSSKQVHAHYHAAAGENPDSIRKNSATFKQMIKDMARRGELRMA